MNQQHEIPSQVLTRKLEESVTTVTILNALFTAMPQGVHPYFQVQLSAIARVLAEVAHRPLRLDSAQQLTELATELAVITGQLGPAETSETTTKTQAVNEADPSVTAQKQHHEEVLKALFPNNSKE